MAKYSPPKQGKFSQIVDVLVLLVMIFGALYIPLWLHLAGSAHIDHPQTNPTWQSLGQNPTMVEKWKQLGFADPFSTASLIVMVIVIVGYFVMMLRFSEREYRDVISEKFDGK